MCFPVKARLVPHECLCCIFCRPSAAIRISFDLEDSYAHFTFSPELLVLINEALDPPVVINPPLVNTNIIIQRIKESDDE